MCLLWILFWKGKVMDGVNFCEWVSNFLELVKVINNMLVE